MSASSQGTLKTMFASAFLFANFAIFLWPMVVLWNLAFDRTFTEWFGNYLIAIFVVPVLFLSVYGWHIRAGKPVNAGMSIAVLFPALLFLGMAIAIYVQSTNLNASLTSEACASAGATSEVQNSWNNAQSFYACCQVKYGNTNWEKLCLDPSILLPEENSPDTPLVLLQNCPAYYDEVTRNSLASSWAYLQYLELNFGCAGFCSAGPALFTHQEYASPTCSSTLKFVSDERLVNTSMMLIVYNAAVIVLFVLWIIAMAKPLRELSTPSKTLLMTRDFPESPSANYAYNDRA